MFHSAGFDFFADFKVAIMQQYGPSFSGINFLNMMVANVDESCTAMAAYWLDPALNFLPAANKILGVWGELVSLCDPYL